MYNRWACVQFWPLSDQSQLGGNESPVQPVWANSPGLSSPLTQPTTPKPKGLRVNIGLSFRFPAIPRGFIGLRRWGLAHAGASKTENFNDSWTIYS